MRKIYVLKENIGPDVITIIDPAKIHYLRDVLRLKPKEEIQVFDDCGFRYLCLIESISSHIALTIKSRHKMDKNEVSASITVACAIPKNSRFDDIVDKLTQLGVDRIIPLQTEHTVVKLDKIKAAARKKRWESIALSASQQSQRNNLPKVEMAKSVDELLSQAKQFDLKLIPTLFGERRSLKEVISGPKPKNILFLIGPEGDFSHREVESALKAGCIAVSLGDLVLRVETAAVSVLSFIRFYLSE